MRFGSLGKPQRGAVSASYHLSAAGFWIFTLLLLLSIRPSVVAQEVPPPVEGKPGAFLGELSWPEAQDRLSQGPLVILPFGAGAKEHGPHLPMNADAVVMEYLCHRAVDSLPVLVAPPILHGWFPAFRDFPGTEVSDPVVFQSYVMEVARSLVRQGAQRLVLLNTGIQMATGLPLAVVAREIRVQTGTPTLLVSWDDLETDEVEALQEQESGGHADELETSIHLVLQPDLVRMDRAVAGDRPVSSPPGPGYRPGLFSRNPKDPAFSTIGVSGDPTLATREKGERLLGI
ncbi:creatininase family protein, partial [Gemmatimonadota bacterium]